MHNISLQKNSLEQIIIHICHKLIIIRLIIICYEIINKPTTEKRNTEKFRVILMNIKSTIYSLPFLSPNSPIYASLLFFKFVPYFSVDS